MGAQRRRVGRNGPARDNRRGEGVDGVEVVVGRVRAFSVALGCGRRCGPLVRRRLRRRLLRQRLEALEDTREERVACPLVRVVAWVFAQLVESYRRRLDALRLERAACARRGAAVDRYRLSWSGHADVESAQAGGDLLREPRGRRGRGARVDANAPSLPRRPRGFLAHRVSPGDLGRAVFRRHGRS